MSGDYFKRLREFLDEKNWRKHKRGSGHWGLTNDDMPGVLVVVSATPSCPFAFEKVKADILRAERKWSFERGTAPKKRGSPVIFPDHSKTTAKERRQRKKALRFALESGGMAQRGVGPEMGPEPGM